MSADGPSEVDRSPVAESRIAWGSTAGITYVYAIGRAGAPLDAAAAKAAGLEEGQVRTVEEGGLAALVSTVPEAMYGAEGMQAQMEDLSQLEATVRRHHAVVETAYESTGVLPMRLATVYLDDAGVVAMLRERAGEFTELLAWLDGHIELGVKVYADPREAREAAAEPAVDDAASDSPGRAYLQRRRAQRRTHRDAYRAAGVVAAQVVDRVTELARARVAHRPQQGGPDSGPGENIANDAYLVAADREDEFRAILADLPADAPGVRIEVTGPWAPYSFATPSSSSSGGA
ncbi:GvpL/GvpF family gas vesicle protein [Streptomyces sp. NPDC048436]|uniref:GvpL/GvpF family gas vesicle protein n=1 Tax=Streptomyces sp. NPDC048436 TaxID=3365550 RepID=UPI00371E67E4